MPWRRACEIVQQAALGLGAAHQAGVVHREVKPGNLMIDQAGVVKRSTWLAKLKISMSKLRKRADYGHPAYMAPDSHGCKNAGPAADAYALGVTLYTLISGELPFRETSTKVILAHMNDPIPICVKSSMIFREGAYITRLWPKNRLIARRMATRWRVRSGPCWSGVTRSNLVAVQTSNAAQQTVISPSHWRCLGGGGYYHCAVTSLLPKGETALLKPQPAAAMLRHRQPLGLARNRNRRLLQKPQLLRLRQS